MLGLDTKIADLEARRCQRWTRITIRVGSCRGLIVMFGVDLFTMGNEGAAGEGFSGNWCSKKTKLSIFRGSMQSWNRRVLCFKCTVRWLSRAWFLGGFGKKKKSYGVGLVTEIGLVERKYEIMKEIKQGLNMDRFWVFESIFWFNLDFNL